MSALRSVRIATAYVRTRANAARLRDRDALAAHQQRLWARLAPALARTPATAGLAGRPLGAFPIREPADLRADLGAWNSLGLSASKILDLARAAEDGAPAAGAVQAGFSTGSEGARGVFLTTPGERADYLGGLLGKLVPLARLARPIRAALILRASNRLYEDIEGAGAAFTFIGLDLGTAAKLEALDRFAPTHLVAPPHVLADMARTAPGHPAFGRLQAIYYGAEPMGALEAAALTEAFGIAPRPLYQATEGFLGAPCRRGVLHLNEDDLVIEREPVAGCSRFTPVVTDLRRRGQPMVRVRLSDLIEPLEPCACGSPRLAIWPVEGRAGDVWRFGAVQVFPREVEAALEAVLPPLARWRAEASRAGVRLWVEADAPAACGALAGLLAARAVALPVVADLEEGMPTPKRRRVRWLG